MGVIVHREWGIRGRAPLSGKSPCAYSVSAVNRNASFALHPGRKGFDMSVVAGN